MTDRGRVPVPGQSLWLLLMNMALFTLLALYLDRVIPNSNGYCAHPLFFLFPSTYGIRLPLNRPIRLASEAYEPLPDEDPDVTGERKTTDEVDPEDPNLGIVIRGIKKRYDSGLSFFNSWLEKTFGVFHIPCCTWLGKKLSLGKSKFAIHELSLFVERGKMLALLGSNGAGKTSIATKASAFRLDFIKVF